MAKIVFDGYRYTGSIFAFYLTLASSLIILLCCFYTTWVLIDFIYFIDLSIIATSYSVFFLFVFLFFYLAVSSLTHSDATSHSFVSLQGIPT